MTQNKFIIYFIVILSHEIIDKMLILEEKLNQT